MAGPSWRVASACQIGTSHLRSGSPCQDTVEQAIVRVGNGQVLVAVACDGAGSAPHSDIGSWLAATTFVELVEVHFENGKPLTSIDRDVIAGWIAATVDRIATRAKADGKRLKDYACTLLAAVVGPDCAVFAQVGDGAIVVSHGEADGWSWVFWPHQGEYANQTTFILSGNATEVLDFSFAPRRINEVALFTDGIQRMVINIATREVNDLFFEAMFQPIRASKARGVDAALSEQLRNYLGSSAVNARTSDDKSLVVATRRRRRTKKQK